MCTGDCRTHLQKLLNNSEENGPYLDPMTALLHEADSLTNVERPNLCLKYITDIVQFLHIPLCPCQGWNNPGDGIASALATWYFIFHRHGIEGCSLLRYTLMPQMTACTLNRAANSVDKVFLD